MRADHPSDTRRDGICLYCKEHLTIIRVDDISNLNECLVTEIVVKNERCSTHTSYDILHNSLNPAISITAGDFNGNVGN